MSKIETSFPSGTERYFVNGCTALLCPHDHMIMHDGNSSDRANLFTIWLTLLQSCYCTTCRRTVGVGSGSGLGRRGTTRSNLVACSLPMPSLGARILHHLQAGHHHSRNRFPESFIVQEYSTRPHPAACAPLPYKRRRLVAAKITAFEAAEGASRSDGSVSSSSGGFEHARACSKPVVRARKLRNIPSELDPPRFPHRAIKFVARFAIPFLGAENRANGPAYPPRHGFPEDDDIVQFYVSSAVLPTARLGTRLHFPPLYASVTGCRKGTSTPNRVHSRSHGLGKVHVALAKLAWPQAERRGCRLDERRAPRTKTLQEGRGGQSIQGVPLSASSRRELSGMSSDHRRKTSDTVGFSSQRATGAGAQYRDD
ncbi:hypothetical protein FFLO_01558 [Filobasidium floriforme]|uniref:Uncharacterized protein n=1 Tax=Filobasidium floriforme TaxID=5210 RepID=A0A8K0NSP2_9TREE|nr:hypothetical protein FFLO_01558 [Filobasidium floriforme]